MAIEYQNIDGKVYAYITKSIRHGKKVDKERTTLGRVLDKERGIYMNRERGVFTYDPKTNTYGEAPEDVSIPSRRTKSKELEILDFGDVFMVSEFLKATELIPVIEAIEYQDSNTLWALIYFYILTQLDKRLCQTWYEGNYTSILYPNANLTDQSINEMLTAIGMEDTCQKFYKACLKWFETNCNKNKDNCTSNTGTGSDAETEHIDDKKAESIPTIQVLVITQKETNIPIWIQDISGNNTADNLPRSIQNELEKYGIKAGSYEIHRETFNAKNRLNLGFISDAASTSVPTNTSDTASCTESLPTDHIQDLIRGQLLIDFIANIIKALLVTELEKANIQFETAILETRNQKCKIYKTYTAPQKPTPSQKAIYNVLNIKVPAKIWQGLKQT